MLEPADLLIRRCPCRRSVSYGSVRDLALVTPGCPGRSGSSQGSSVWLPAWLPTVRPAERADGFQEHTRFTVRPRIYLDFQCGRLASDPRPSRVYPAASDWPLRPELAAPLSVWPSSQLTRCAGGRAGWRLSGDVAVLRCTAPALSTKTPGAVLAGRRSAWEHNGKHHWLNLRSTSRAWHAAWRASSATRRYSSAWLGQ